MNGQKNNTKNMQIIIVKLISFKNAVGIVWMNYKKK